MVPSMHEVHQEVFQDVLQTLWWRYADPCMVLMMHPDAGRELGEIEH